MISDDADRCHHTNQPIRTPREQQKTPSPSNRRSSRSRSPSRKRASSSFFCPGAKRTDTLVGSSVSLCVTRKRRCLFLLYFLSKTKKSTTSISALRRDTSSHQPHTPNALRTTKNPMVCSATSGCTLHIITQFQKFCQFFVLAQSERNVILTFSLRNPIFCC